MKKILIFVILYCSFALSSGTVFPNFQHEKEEDRKYWERRAAQQREWEANEAERQRRIRHNEEGQARHEQSIERKAQEVRDANERMSRYADQACCHVKLKYTCKGNGAIHQLVKAYQNKCIDFGKYKDLRTLKQIPICHPITHEYLGRCDTQDPGQYEIGDGDSKKWVSAFDDSCDIFHKLRKGEGHDKNRL